MNTLPAPQPATPATRRSVTVDTLDSSMPPTSPTSQSSRQSSAITPTTPSSRTLRSSKSPPSPACPVAIPKPSKAPIAKEKGVISKPAVDIHRLLAVEVPPDVRGVLVRLFYYLMSRH